LDSSSQRELRTANQKVTEQLAELERTRNRLTDSQKALQQITTSRDTLESQLHQLQVREA